MTYTFIQLINPYEYTLLNTQKKDFTFDFCCAGFTAVLEVICQLDICKVSKVKTVEGARHMN